MAADDPGDEVDEIEVFSWADVPDLSRRPRSRPTAGSRATSHKKKTVRKEMDRRV
jgi:hypothetical protein